MTSAPTLETERLLIRAYRASDGDAHGAMLTDPDVLRFIHAEPMGREDAWRRMLTAPGLWALLGFGYWAVERKADGRYIGQLGFGDFHRQIEPSLEGLPEMGWMFIGEAQGKGYAFEAVTAALAWVERALPGREIVAIIAEGNDRSIALALKAGFRQAERAVHKGDDVLIFRR